jgi:deazaflavin-dependent oxidoreductase (nitroreductase family)
VSIQGAFLKLHQALYTNSGGRIGHRMLGVPTLLLRTTGRRSGARRTNALVYAKDGADYVLVGSNGGADRSPGWFFNARDNPVVELQVRTKAFPGAARVVDSGDADYDRLWRLVNDNNSNRYDGYQSHTKRPIPLIVVSPS